MSAVPEEYDELHSLVDRLTLKQVRALRAVALELVENEPDPVSGPGGRRRRLSFAGIIEDEPDSAQSPLQRRQEPPRRAFHPAAVSRAHFGFLDQK
ncbi:hypothetical protein [Planomonospora sphaerica]|uniref:hypothetical protein n=1 Tax=Planomonospora sphaerica TaxID=161355 RepID=UPI00129067C1|nr:hypothetical protein [Planomonospora sphaerica]